MRVSGVVVVMALWASLAAAQAGDVVMLANGGRLRGTVEVYEPGMDLVILLPDGTRRTVPAAEVERVFFGDAVPEASAAEPPVAEEGEEPGAAGAEGEPAHEPASEPAPLAPVTPAPPRMEATPRSEVMPGVQHLGALEPIAGIPEGEARNYSVGLERGTRPWMQDPSFASLPNGAVHVGVQLRGGASFPDPLAPALDGSLLVDFLLAAPMHLRLAALVGLAPANLSNLAARVGARLSFGFDVAQRFCLRLGIEAGLLPDGPLGYFGPQIELVGKLTSDGQLEFGLEVSGLLQPRCYYAGSCSGLGFRVQPQIILGWLF